MWHVCRVGSTAPHQCGSGGPLLFRQTDKMRYLDAGLAVVVVDVRGALGPRQVDEGQLPRRLTRLLKMHLHKAGGSATLESTPGQIFSQSPTDATRFW